MKTFLLAALMGISSLAWAADYQSELDLVGKVDALRTAGVSYEQAERLAIVYTTEYYLKGNPPGPGERRADKVLFALDEYYHERLQEMLEIYVQDIPDVNLDQPSPPEIVRIAAYYVKVARVPRTRPPAGGAR
jgi:hypothetical protein